MAEGKSEDKTKQSFFNLDTVKAVIFDFLFMSLGHRAAEKFSELLKGEGSPVTAPAQELGKSIGQEISSKHIFGEAWAEINRTDPEKARRIRNFLQKFCDPRERAEFIIHSAQTGPTKNETVQFLEALASISDDNEIKDFLKNIQYIGEPAEDFKMKVRKFLESAEDFFAVEAERTERWRKERKELQKYRYGKSWSKPFRYIFGWPVKSGSRS